MSVTVSFLASAETPLLTSSPPNWEEIPTEELDWFHCSRFGGFLFRRMAIKIFLSPGNDAGLSVHSASLYEPEKHNLAALASSAKQNSTRVLPRRRVNHCKLGRSPGRSTRRTSLVFVRLSRGMATSDLKQGEKQPHLRRPLRLVDLVLTQVLFVVGGGWVGTAAGLGRSQAVTWMMAMLVFYLPVAAAVLCLNREMPLEGGLYVWARIAFGNFAGFLVAWNIWVYSIATAALILYLFPTALGYMFGLAWLPENHLVSLAIPLGILAVIVVAAAGGLQAGKWLQIVGGVAMMTVFLGLILLPAFGLLHHRPIHWDPIPLQVPRHDLLALCRLGQMMIGGLAGLEYIAILAGETQVPESTIGRSVQIASPIICIMFVLGTSSVLAYAHGPINLIAPVPQTFRLALGSAGWGGFVAFLAIVLLLLREIGTASLVFTGATRLALTAGWDHLLPAWFTRIDKRSGAPTNAIIFTAMLIVAVLVLASTGVHAQEAFQVMINAGTAHYALAYMAMFSVPLFGIIALRRRLPIWLRWVSAVGLVATVFSLAVSAFPIVDVADASAYAAKVLGTTAVSNLAAIVFYLARRSTIAPIPAH